MFTVHVRTSIQLISNGWMKQNEFSFIIIIIHTFGLMDVECGYWLIWCGNSACKEECFIKLSIQFNPITVNYTRDTRHIVYKPTTWSRLNNWVRFGLANVCILYECSVDYIAIALVWIRITWLSVKVIDFFSVFIHFILVRHRRHFALLFASIK